MTPATTDDEVVRDLPIIYRSKAGYDVGGTKTDVRIVHLRTGRIAFERSYVSPKYGSLDAIIVRSLLDAGVRPESAGIVAAGALQPDRTIQMAAKTVTHWPIFDPAATATRLGINILADNDMVGACAGLRAGRTPYDELVVGVADDDGPKIVVTFSTGVNHGLLLPSGKIYKAESGHPTWQPVTLMEYHYLVFLRKRYGCNLISVEQAASGGQGFNNAFDFLVEEGANFGIKPPPAVLVDGVLKRRANDHGIGHLIDQYASVRDPFCRAVWELVGSILGQYLRNLILTVMPTGGVYLIGSVAMAAANYMLAHTPFMDRMMPAGAMYNNLVARTPIRLITDPSLSVRGALDLAP